MLFQSMKMCTNLLPGHLGKSWLIRGSGHRVGSSVVAYRALFYEESIPLSVSWQLIVPACSSCRSCRNDSDGLWNDDSKAYEE